VRDPVVLRPARLVRAFGAMIAVLHALNLAAQAAKLRGRGAEPWVRFVDVDAEANLPTWCSSVLLLACAAAASLMALRTATSRRGWRLVAALLALLAADEVVCVHERVAAAMLAWVGAHRVARAWVWAVGGAVVAVLGAGLVPFLRGLAPGLRNGLMLAGAVFVTGGLGFEAIGQLYAASHGWANVPYVTLAAVEELLEMVGALLCFRAIARDLGAVELRFETQ
jgi:hypothetical protein